MARLIVKRVFNPKEPILARRAFSAAGRTFQPGDVFNWSRLSVSPRRVRQMYDAGMLMHSDEPVAEETAADEPVAEETVVATEIPPAPPADNSDLEVDSLVVLQAIAQREGAVLKSTKVAQRQAIIDKRQG
jgi:hypothetical protein